MTAISKKKVTVDDVLKMAETSLEDLAIAEVTQDVYTKLYVRLDGNKVVGATLAREASRNNELVADDGTELIEVWGGGSSDSTGDDCVEEDGRQCLTCDDCDDCEAWYERKQLINEAISNVLSNL